MLDKIEKSINYQFKDKELLFEALTHPSMQKICENNNRIDYQRLEFLGDGLLSGVISEIAYNKFPNSREGLLSRVKSYLASGQVIQDVAKKINLGKFIKMSSGEKKSNGHSNPKNLENAMEAIIGAVYLDSDFSTVKNVVMNLWQHFIDDIDTQSLDPKTQLQEISYKKDKSLPKYEIIDKIGKGHSPIFTVQVSACGASSTAKGRSVKIAQVNAAKILLDLLNNKDE